MDILTISSIIAAFMSGVLGVGAVLRNWRSRLCVIFSILCGFLVIHDILRIIDSFADAPLTPRTHLFVTLILQPLTLALLGEIVSGIDRSLRKWMAAYIPIAVVIFLFLSFGKYPRLEEAFVFGAHAAFLIPATLWIYYLARAERRAGLTREKLRLRYLSWGAVFTLGFHVTDSLHFGLVESVPALGTLARSLYLFFVFQTVIQRELMTFEEVVSKGALFGGLALMLSTIYMLLVSWVGDQQGLFFFNTFIASFMILVLFDPIRKMTMKLVRKLFLKRNLVLEAELETLSRDLMGVVDPLEISRHLQKAFSRVLGVESASLYVLERDGLSYTCIESPGTKDMTASNSLIEYMALRRGRPFVVETVENDRDSFYSSQHRRFCELCLESMRALGADFIVPFLYEARVTGFCAVVTGQRIALSNEQLRLFIPVARQVALLLKNAQVFNAIRDREKLAVVGEMAAGLAHEIKNPLGAIKGAAQLLKETREEEQTEDFVRIIVDEVNRLSSVLTHFIDYAKPRRNDPKALCEPLKVIDHTVQLVLRDSRVVFEVDVDPPGLSLEGDPDLLKQVLLNLFLNAVQAMEEMPEPRVLRVRVREIRPRVIFNLKESLPLYKIWEGWKVSSEKHEPYVEFEISDNGPGIPAEEREQIFIPFYTTKAKGTGLGLAICQRIIEGWGGTISVKPNHPRGMVFVIHLPQKRKEAESFSGRVPSGESFA
jgi:two-component system, NtrC family, sensor histidine kinase HydH